jgi:hypothetical protein
MSSLQLKLILLIHSAPTNDIELRELLKKAGVIERFTPYLGGAPGGRGPVRAKKQGSGWRSAENEAIAELTLAVATIAMLAAIVAAVRCCSA